MIDSLINWLLNSKCLINWCPGVAQLSARHWQMIKISPSSIKLQRMGLKCGRKRLNSSAKSPIMSSSIKFQSDGSDSLLRFAIHIELRGGLLVVVSFILRLSFFIFILLCCKIIINQEIIMFDWRSWLVWRVNWYLVMGDFVLN